MGRPGSKRRPLGHRLPFDPALVPVWSRADRAVRTVPPAVCSQVKRAVICACHVHLCTSMFVKAYGLIVRVPRESSNRCTSRRLCHKHVFVMQAGLPHRTRRRPRIIHLAPKTSTDQLPIRPATQNRPKAACAPPISPASRDSPLASPPEQRRPVASTLDRLGWGKPTRRTSPGQRASPQRPRGSPRGRHHPARPPRGAQPRRCKGARAQGPRAPRPRP